MPATRRRPPAVAAPRAVAAVVLVLVPALAGSTVLAGPAAAVGGSVTAPEAGRVVTAPELVTVTAVVDGPSAVPVELRLAGPTDEGDGTVVARLDDPAGGELRYVLDPACPPGSGPCEEAVPARNGTWTAVLTGGATDRRSFVLELAPAPPRDVSVVPSEGDALVVSWAVNREPDLVAYAVGTSTGTTLVEPVDPTASCTEERCTVVVEPPPGEVLTVTAVRAACPGCPGTLRSRASSPTEGGQLPPPTPPPTPTAGPTGTDPSLRPGSTAAAAGGSSGAVDPGGFGGLTLGPDLLPAPAVPAPVVAPPLGDDAVSVGAPDPGLLPVPPPLPPRSASPVAAATTVAAPVAAALLLAVAVAHSVVVVPAGRARRPRVRPAGAPATVTTEPRPGHPPGRRARSAPRERSPRSGPPARDRPVVVTRTVVAAPGRRARGPAPTARTLVHQPTVGEEHVLAPPPLSRRLRRWSLLRRGPARPSGPPAADAKPRSRGPGRRG